MNREALRDAIGALLVVGGVLAYLLLLEVMR